MKCFVRDSHYGITDMGLYYIKMVANNIFLKYTWKGCNTHNSSLLNREISNAVENIRQQFSINSSDTLRYIKGLLVHYIYENIRNK